ncbi:hypothetical protein ES703_116010 [subsurface metagenome]
MKITYDDCLYLNMTFQLVDFEKVMSDSGKKWLSDFKDRLQKELQQ